MIARNIPLALALAVSVLAVGTDCLADKRPADPPILKYKDELTGIVIREQTFDGGEIRFPIERLTIAQSYYLLGEGDRSVPQTLKVICLINDAGLVQDYTCHDQTGGRIPAGIAQARDMELFSAARSFQSRKAGKNAPVRRARYVLGIEPGPGAAIDLASGPLVPMSLVNGLVANPNRTYPPRALRFEAQGAQTVECQVQADLSLICHAIRFDPIKDEEFFVGAERTYFHRNPVSPHLSDGRPAKGVRFQFRIRWVIPAESNDEAPN